MLAILRGPEHQDVAYVYSGSAVWFGPPVTGGLPRTDSGRVSCVHEEEAKWWPIHHSWGGGIPEVRDSSG